MLEDIAIPGKQSEVRPQSVTSRCIYIRVVLRVSSVLPSNIAHSQDLYLGWQEAEEVEAVQCWQQSPEGEGQEDLEACAGCEA